MPPHPPSTNPAMKRILWRSSRLLVRPQNPHILLRPVQHPARSFRRHKRLKLADAEHLIAATESMRHPLALNAVLTFRQMDVDLIAVVMAGSSERVDTVRDVKPWHLARSRAGDVDQCVKSFWSEIRLMEVNCRFEPENLCELAAQLFADEKQGLAWDIQGVIGIAAR